MWKINEISRAQSWKYYESKYFENTDVDYIIKTLVYGWKILQKHLEINFMNFLFLNIPRENEYEKNFFDDFYDYLLNKTQNKSPCLL